MAKQKKSDAVWHDTAAILAEIEKILRFTDTHGRNPFNAKCGVYVFYDYDEEPIYVGKTKEKLRVRVRRHLTNQRTDAVAMSVLDPFEVAELQVFPFYDLEGPAPGESEKDYRTRREDTLAAAEFTLYESVRAASEVKETLNEAKVPERAAITLPDGYRFRIVPDPLYEQNNHPDLRIARRANTIADLAQVIVERNVSVGLRKTLITQAQRLERLARKRFEALGGQAAIPVEAEEEDTGESEG